MIERSYKETGTLSREGMLGWTEFHLTHCLYHLGKYGEAMEMNRKSIDHFNVCDSTWGVSFSYWHLSFLLAGQGKYDEAEYYIKESFNNLVPLIGYDNVDIAKTYHYQSKIRIFARNAEGATESLERAKQIYEKLGFSVYAAQAENEIARLKTGQFWEPDIL